MTDLRKAVEMAVPLLIGYREYSGDHRIANRCGEVLEALRQALAQPEFDTPESHIVKWSIPVDPNNFGEPLAQPEQEPCKCIDQFWCATFDRCKRNE